MMLDRFTYGDEVIEYEVFHSAKRQKKIAIHVHPDASVQVDAPEDQDSNVIRQAVMKRARWITKHVRDAREMRKHVLLRTYVSGESHFYLGRRYQLKVSVSKKASPGVKMLRGKLCVETRSKQANVVKKLLGEWYRERARDVFAKRVESVLDRVVWLEVAPDWRLHSMQKQWGSCSPQGRILLNPHLVKAPRDCIDYVIAHELCHLKEHNHSPDYYRILSTIMPDWQPIKAKLDGMAELILNE